MTKVYLYIIALSLLSGSCSIHEKQVQVKFSGQTQGTYYAITYFDTKARNFQHQVDSLLKAFDLSVSLWEPNSILSRINNNDPYVKPDQIFIELYHKSTEVYKMSGGAFDPTIGPLVNSWGFGFTDRLKVDQNVVDSLLPYVGFNKVSLTNDGFVKSDPRIQLDFNAIAQGYAVDLIAKFLRDRGIFNYLIDIGGEVMAKGEKPTGESWKVGIEKPQDNAAYGEGLQAIVKLNNKALATSGNYRKFFEEDGIRYSHTIDPQTGYPVKHSLLSVSVLADDCASADAWATVFMVMGLKKAKTFIAKHEDIEAYFIFADTNNQLSTYFTKGFENILIDE